MIIGFSRSIGPVRLDCVLVEDHTSEIEITANPIETGAEVNDHAYIMPKKVTLEIANHNAASTYTALVRFQEQRSPFTLVTGLAAYKNMMVKRISARREVSTSRILSGTVDLQEVIIVDTAGINAPGGTASMPPAGNPGGAGSILSARPSASRSIDLGTALRASGTVQRGDMPARDAPLTGKTPTAVQNRAILQGVFQ